MKATDELKKEHEGIELMLQILQAMADKCRHGDGVDPEHFDDVLEFLAIFVDKCHHGKEEEFLFPALEAEGVPREGGPIGIMLNEHEEGRRIVARLKDAVADYKSDAKANASSLQPIIGEYVALLNQHIAKENTVLFPMADTKLSSDKDAELYEAFEKLERERIGEGKHEEFHSLLKRLNHEYLQ